MHEEARDPVLALPRELALAGPVATQPDLDVAARVDVSVAHEPVHRRAVRDLDAEHLRSGVRMRVEVDERDRHRAATRPHGCPARRSEWSPPSDDRHHTGLDDLRGRAPRSTHASRAGSAGTTGASPKSTTRSTSAQSTRASRCGPGGQLAARIARGPNRVPGRSETRSSVGAPTTATSTPASSAGVLRVRHPREREQALRSPACPGSPRALHRSSGSITGQIVAPLTYAASHVAAPTAHRPVGRPRRGARVRRRMALQRRRPRGVPFWLPFVVLLAAEVEFVVRGRRQAPRRAARARPARARGRRSRLRRARRGRRRPPLRPATGSPGRAAAGGSAGSWVRRRPPWSCLAARSDRAATWVALPAEAGAGRSALHRGGVDASPAAGARFAATTGTRSPAPEATPSVSRFSGSRLAYLDPTVCRALYDLAFGGDRRGRERTAEALVVLAHEAVHLGGERREGVTECLALQEAGPLAVRLGLDAGTRTPDPADRIRPTTRGAKRDPSGLRAADELPGRRRARPSVQRPTLPVLDAQDAPRPDVERARRSTHRASRRGR